MAYKTPVYDPFFNLFQLLRSIAAELPIPPMVSPNLSRALEGMKP